MITFGPVPSRRLGQSMGINNIPPKVCSYSCIYCQIGRTIKMEIDRKEHYDTDLILQDVHSRTDKVRSGGDKIDYLTFVPDGEPTLDINLGREIDLLGQFGIRIAVITNSSLLWSEEVRRVLLKADWVSVKVDATDEETWRKINRPHPGLKLGYILDGIIEFSKMYSGVLTTETMLVKDINDGEGQIKEIARYLAKIKPAIAYLSIPTRPPAVRNVQPPAEENINRCYQIFNEYLENVEYLVGYEGNAFSFTGDTEEDILSITAVHPMREDAVRSFLVRSGSDWVIIEKLITEGRLVEIKYMDKYFYLRKINPD